MKTPCFAKYLPTFVPVKGWGEDFPPGDFWIRNTHSAHWVTQWHQRQFQYSPMTDVHYRSISQVFPSCSETTEWIHSTTQIITSVQKGLSGQCRHISMSLDKSERNLRVLATQPITTTRITLVVFLSSEPTIIKNQDPSQLPAVQASWALMCSHPLILPAMQVTWGGAGKRIDSSSVSN